MEHPSHEYLAQWKGSVELDSNRGVLHRLTILLNLAQRSSQYLEKEYPLLDFSIFFIFFCLP